MSDVAQANHHGDAPGGPPDETSRSALEATRMTKIFGSYKAVDEFSITLNAGEITAMIGPNGAGKSTVINLLTGACIPDGGEMVLDGATVTGQDAHVLAGRGIARTFQTPKMFGAMTVRETVMLARDQLHSATLAGALTHTPGMRRNESASAERAGAWLDFVGLGDAAQQTVSILPMGSQRLLEVARAMAQEPYVLLLDEPAAGLDHTETQQLSELVKRIAAAGVAILLVEHDMRMVMSIADRIVVLDRGRQIAAGDPAEIGRNPTVIDAYLGQGSK